MYSRLQICCLDAQLLLIQSILSRCLPIVEYTSKKKKNLENWLSILVVPYWWLLQVEFVNLDIIVLDSTQLIQESQKQPMFAAVHLNACMQNNSLDLTHDD